MRYLSGPVVGRKSCVAPSALGFIVRLDLGLAAEAKYVAGRWPFLRWVLYFTGVLWLAVRPC